MNTAEELKEIVRQKYGEIAQANNAQGVDCGCDQRPAAIPTHLQMHRTQF